MSKKLTIGSFIVLVAAWAAWAAVPTTLNDFFMPGSQPGESGNIEHPGKCDNCHGGYDPAVEPAFNWRGSMMAQAARDPLFYACMAIANQDAPDSGDLCIRCHTPDGWLAGRSVPTDGSALNNNDMEGVQCDFCHKLVKPTPLNTNPYPGDPAYTSSTYPADQAYLSGITAIPPVSADGMYVADANNAKRGPYVDTVARHQIFYSPFHRDAALCGTCHDVSNPAFSVQPGGDYAPNAFNAPAPDFHPYSLFPVERTFSEWKMSSYNTPLGVFAPQFGGNKQYVSTCQDCHMKDVTGLGCNKNGAPVRSDLPLHDMTGGNTFIPGLVGQIYPADVDLAALDAGVQRATGMLGMAASMGLTVAPAGAEYHVTVTVTNETGHKLPSGYPEGRRIWLNVKAYDSGQTVVYESGAYDFNTGELGHDPEVKIYQIKPGLSPELAAALFEATGDPTFVAGPSFHFVLNDTIYSDNRIPPRGFTNTNFELIGSPPVAYTYADGQYSDQTQYLIPSTSKRVEATLYYQTLSKGYVTFLRDENRTNNTGQVLYDLWNANGKSAPVVMNSISYDIPAPVPPVADFVGSPTSGNAPLTVSFTDLSTNGPTSWSWTFGDGGSSTAQNPTYTYNAADTYTVSLTATNGYGSNTNTKTGYIVVTQPTLMHVSNIVVTRNVGGGNRANGVALVTIVNQSNSPVSGATVTGTFTGPSSGTASGTTNAAGQVTLSSRTVKNPVGEWCFEVTSVTKTGAVYDAIANVVTKACESGPVFITEVDMSAAAPTAFALWSNANPARGAAAINFALPSGRHVKLEVFNVKGQRVASLAEAYYGPGVHTLLWDGYGAPAGVYVIHMEAEDIVRTHRLVLLK